MSASPGPLALRFLSGRLEGGVVPLEPGCALVIGRQPGADLQLSEDLVSRRHARLTFDGSAVVIEDLGSTNGTFINGARVDRAEVAEGDRVLVGESIFTVIARRPARPSSATEVRPLSGGPAATGHQPATAIQGRLDEVPLSDVLQLIATARKSGVLVIRSGPREAAVRLDHGCVAGCTLDGRDDDTSHKLLFRLFEWSAGEFELRPGDVATRRAVGLEPLELLLMEAARQVDELRRWRATLPDRFVVNPEFPEVALDQQDRWLIAVAARCPTLDAILDGTPLPDAAAAERLGSLHARGVLLAVPETRASSGS